MAKHTIKQHDTRVLDYGHDVASPYHDWIAKQGYINEPVQANPDQLEECAKNNFFADKHDYTMAHVLINRFLDEQGNFPTLSTRENEVLRFYTAGQSQYAIAKQLDIKRTTVSYYLARASKKLKKLLNGVKGVEF